MYVCMYELFKKFQKIIFICNFSSIEKCFEKERQSVVIISLRSLLWMEKTGWFYRVEKRNLCDLDQQGQLGCPRPVDAILAVGLRAIFYWTAVFILPLDFLLGLVHGSIDLRILHLLHKSF